MPLFCFCVAMSLGFKLLQEEVDDASTGKPARSSL